MSNSNKQTFKHAQITNTVTKARAASAHNSERSEVLNKSVLKKRL